MKYPRFAGEYPPLKLIPEYYSSNPILRYVFRNRLAIAMKMAHLQESDILLDIGTGPGLLMLGASNQVNVALGLDIHRMLPSVRQMLNSSGVGNHELIRADANYLPIKNQSISLVFALDVLEHIPTAVLVIQEINRVLKEDGRAVISIPMENFLYRLGRLIFKFAKGPCAGEHFHDFHSINCMLSKHMKVKARQRIGRIVALFILMLCVKKFDQPVSEICN